MKKRVFTVLQCGFLGMALLLSVCSRAGTVIVSGDSNLGNNNPHLGTFYTTLFAGQDVFVSPAFGFLTNTSAELASTAASYTTGAITGLALDGKDWLVASGENSFSASEIADIVLFGTTGGNIFLFGEGGYSSINGDTNGLLGALGSSLALSTNSMAEELSAWSAGSGGIGLSPFTAGITSFAGNLAASVSGGTALFTSDRGHIIVAADQIPDIFAVPAPATGALICLSLLGIGISRRRAGSSSRAPF